MDLFLQAFLSKTIDTPALDLPPLGDEVRERFHQLCILQTVAKRFHNFLGSQEDLDEEELTSDSDCRFKKSMFDFCFLF